MNHTDRVADPGTVPSLLEHGWARVAGSSESARLDAELLLAHVLRRPRSQLHAHDEEPSMRRDGALSRRCGAAQPGEPVAYLTGEREFWSLALVVTPEVLIHARRPNLRWSAAWRCAAPSGGGRRSRHRLGRDRAGAGSRTAAVAHHGHRQAAGALQVARGNAAAPGHPECQFRNGDWLAPLQGREFDLIVSNPPYVAAADPALTRTAL